MSDEFTEEIERVEETLNDLRETVDQLKDKQKGTGHLEELWAILRHRVQTGVGSPTLNRSGDKTPVYTFEDDLLPCLEKGGAVRIGQWEHRKAEVAVCLFMGPTGESGNFHLDVVTAQGTFHGTTAESLNDALVQTEICLYLMHHVQNDFELHSSA